ncbi:MAG TPA: hypothetical protein VKZ99_01130 [Gammaproteobacteria bacterium]|nr:hypothetical protein [Gammaproteobacteria bacterium]
MSWSFDTPVSGLSLLLMILLAVLALYFARATARAALLAAGNTFYRALRLASSATVRAERQLAVRNREVLLAQGREAAERAIEREFERVQTAVKKELADFPAMHRRLSESITAIEEDYERSREVPPAPPGWVKAVQAVADIPKADATVARVLEDMHGSLKKIEEQALTEYRKNSRERHALLKRALPHWRALLENIGSFDKKLSRLLDRAVAIDRHMDDYEEINRGSDSALRKLSASSLSQFFVSMFVLAIAVGGAIINFNLIARPMAEMVGGTNMIGGMKIADIAALVIILVEISMGLFLMESLRITRLFPVIAALDDRMRVRMIWITLFFLTALASVEAGLAFMREILVQDELATSAMLRGETAALAEPRFLWITTAAQMGMGFILPFALTFVAIPLESFIHSLRTVLGVLAGAVLKLVATLLRVLASAIRGLARSLVYVYDVVIFLPLWIEGRVMAMRGGARAAEGRA